MTTPTEYIAAKRAEGLDTPAILARQVSALAEEAEAYRAADAVAAALQAQHQARADEALRQVERIRADRARTLEAVGTAQWFRRAVVRLLAEAGGVFRPGIKSAKLAPGVDLVTRAAGDKIEVRDRQALEGLTPFARKSSSSWNESLAKGSLVVSADGTALAILDGAGPFVVAPDGKTLVHPTAGDVLKGTLVPTSVAVYAPPTRTWKLDINGVEFALPEWTEDAPMPEDPADNEEDDPFAGA